ncbi:unnamed protein product [Musa acuminata subsp. burmannicoides]
MDQDGCVMIKKSSIVKPLTCHLCSDIINDATTITACLHTFCKGCIYRAFQDGTLHSCPKCHKYLGPSPQTYLRPDPMVQNFRNKIFMYEKPKAAPSLSRQREVEDKENGKSTEKTKDAESKDEASASVGD